MFRGKGYYIGFSTFLMVAVGVFFLVHRYFDQNTKRLPASVPKTNIFDFTALEGAALETAMRKQILKYSETVTKNGDFGFKLGHFQLRSPEGKPIAACELFNEITLVFEAEGLASHGDRPKLTISGPCKSSEARVQTNAIWVPVRKILAMPPGPIDMPLDSGGNYAIRVEDVSFTWPQHWVLSSVKFSDKNNTSADILIDRREVYQYSKTPLMMYWVSKNTN